MPARPTNVALIGTVALLLVLGGGYGAHRLRGGGAVAGVCPHTLAPEGCPFCTPSLLETRGFCAGHGVPEAVCTRCHRDLVPAFRAAGDWCAEHGVPESQCVACDPAAATRYQRPGPADGGPAGTSCEHGVPGERCFVCVPALIEQRGPCVEHGVPEALCTRCDASLVPAFQAIYDWCAEHGVPESQCATCNPQLAAPPPPRVNVPASPEERRETPPAPGCRTHTQRIVLASPDVVRQAGLVTTPVVRGPFRDVLRVPAELVHAADRRAVLSSRAGGTVADVPVSLGDAVAQGQVVALVDSPELGAAKAELRSALALLELWERNHARELELVAQGVGTQRHVIAADTRRTEVRVELDRAEERLRGLGLSGEQVADARAGGTSAVLHVRAPFAGVVVERHAVRGEVVEPGRPLVVVVDTSTLWAHLDVPEAALARLRLGQPVALALQALRGETLSGAITWISTEVDRRTRALRARAEVQNEGGRLRANLFGTADVTLADRPDALLVPRDAVQWEGCCNVVFVPEGAATFAPRKVTLGGATDTHVEVLSGVSAGERVVSVGAFLLKTELLRGSIGAGCCEGEE